MALCFVQARIACFFKAGFPCIKCLATNTCLGTRLCHIATFLPGLEQQISLLGSRGRKIRSFLFHALQHTSILLLVYPHLDEYRFNKFPRNFANDLLVRGLVTINDSPPHTDREHKYDVNVTEFGKQFLEFVLSSDAVSDDEDEEVE